MEMFAGSYECEYLTFTSRAPVTFRLSPEKMAVQFNELADLARAPARANKTRASVKWGQKLVTDRRDLNYIVCRSLSLSHTHLHSFGWREKRAHNYRYRSPKFGALGKGVLSLEGTLQRITLLRYEQLPSSRRPHMPLLTQLSPLCRSTCANDGRPTAITSALVAHRGASYTHRHTYRRTYRLTKRPNQSIDPSIHLVAATTRK